MKTIIRRLFLIFNVIYHIFSFQPKKAGMRNIHQSDLSVVQDISAQELAGEVNGQLTLCRSNSPIGILSIELHAVLDGNVKTLPSNTPCSSMESIPIGLLDRQRVNPSRRNSPSGSIGAWHEGVSFFMSLTVQ